MKITTHLLEVGKECDIDIIRKKVYSIDSIYCEYTHLDEICKMGAEAIEMETAVFFRCMNLMEKRGTALLCVSDNAAMNQHLTGRSQEYTERYHRSRGKNIALLINGLLKKIGG